MKRRFTRILAALALLVGLTIPMGVWGQAPVGTTLWGETWTGGDANETPSAYGFEGTTVYGGATLTYAQSSTNTKLYEEALAGGESPELLLSKSNQTWTISNIPTGQATGMALTFKSNKTTFDVTSTTTGITISGSQKSWTIAATSSVTTFNLTIKNTGSSNARIDDIVLSVTTAGGDTPQPTTYTVTYDANGGTGTMTDSNSPYTAGATVTVLGNEFTRTDYDFDHWNTAADDSGTNYDEDDTFTINANTTLYAQWTENTTPSGTTATLNIAEYAAANEWQNDTKYTVATVAPVTFTANGGGNTGKYYTSGNNWRFYQNESASITISVAEGYTLVSVKPTYTVSNTGVLKNGNATIESGTTVNVSGTSATFTVGNSGSATNGQVRFTNIDVIYVSNGSTQTTSDLTITNQSTDLTFDLYNNTTAQVISYTTSSTGAITITPAESDYFSYVHDAAAKTITVTPTAVTPSAQTVTINQAADDDYYAGTATFTVSVANSDPNLPGTQNNPYTVAQAIAATPSNGDVYIQGIVSSFYNTSIVGDGSNYRYYISDDGTTTTQLLVYKGKGLNQATFTSADDLLVGDEVVIYGTLITYQSAPEVASGNYLYSWNRPSTPSQEYTLTVTASENVEIFTFVGESTDPGVEGSTTLQVYNGTEVGLSVSVTEGYVLTLMVDGTDVTSQLDESGYYTFNMPNHDVTVTATAVEFVPSTGDEYALYTGELVEGDYLIVYDGGAMNTTVDSDRLQYVEVSATNNVIVTDNAEIVWHIAPSGQYWTIYNADAGEYAASTGAKNKAQMLADGTDDKALWTVSGTETYEFVNKKNTDNSVNANLRKNGTYGFACYATSTGGALSLYKKVEPAYTLTINAHTIDGGWYLIASPVAVDPADVEGMTIEDSENPNYSNFDLYYFDQTGGQNGKEWKNYKANHFDLELGKGYLYANANTVDLTFTGIENGDFTDVDLPYVQGNTIQSLYLAGNSKTTTETFYVYDGELNQIAFNYLVMNEDGNGFTSGQATSFEAQPLQGFFVQAPEASTTLSTTDLSKAGGVSLLNVQVMRNRGTVVDNAIVSFSNGPTMKKFQLFENSTKLYIPQDNEDYAIVRSEAQGELPVSFRASENGTYTLSMNVENVDMNYLHLIDNMTGMDIDLLQTPSYTFEANTNDYANRFKLVFAANGANEADEASFAFFSDGNLIVNNEGNATLQVIDINGRILSSETISGSCSKAINATTGVYMLRLINGDNVKVQKVVVR